MEITVSKIEKEKIKPKYRKIIYGGNEGTNIKSFSLEDYFYDGRTYKVSLQEDKIFPVLVVRCNIYGEKFYYEINRLPN